MLSRRGLIGISCCLLAAGLHVMAIPLPEQPRERLSDSALLDAILEAAGPDGLQQRTKTVQAEIDAVVARMGHKPPSYRRARKLHNLLHRSYLRTYDPEADQLLGIVRSGHYNCVSGVLFYGMIARALGYNPQVIAYPGHVLLRIRVKGRIIEIETTSKFGFDVGWLIYRNRRGGGGDWLQPELHRESFDSHRYGEQAGSVWLVSLDEAVGFAWVNEAWRSLSDGEAALAAEQVHVARRYLPELAQAEGVRRLLVQAFRREYERGRFDAAYRIAEIDVDLFPASTTSHDRILAAALKRIEAACDAGAPNTGERILDQVSRACPSPLEVARLERRTTPVITAAAVRNGDWVLARRTAERYAAAEPDPVESTRLLEWVESRSSTELQSFGDPSCRVSVFPADSNGMQLESR